MNNKVSFGIGLLIGIVTGGGAGFYISKKLSDKSKEAEIASVREKFDNMQKDLIDKNRKEKERLQEVFNQATEQTLETYGELVQEYGYVSGEVERPEQEEPSYEPTPEEVKVHEFVQQVADTKVEVEEEPKHYDTYLIEAGDTVDTNYEFKSLTYYPANGKLTDESGNGVNALKLLGREILDDIPRFMSEGQYVIYARNDGLQKDFEIELVE